jgi:predicted nuclease of restriction endonuclease-like RecB superfamily
VNLKGDLEPIVYKHILSRPDLLSVDYESERLKYTVAETKTYIPDFIIVTKSGKKIYLEVKGYFRPADRKKMLLVKEQHPDKDIRLVFKYNNKINPKSNTRYADWAEKHGFLYCLKGVIPEEWYD